MFAINNISHITHDYSESNSATSISSSVYVLTLITSFLDILNITA